MRIIPDAVKAQARELWAQGGAVEARPVDAIALAIVLERERCAKIADDVGREPCSCGGSCYKPDECEVFDAWFYEGCEAVASAIRSGE